MKKKAKKQQQQQLLVCDLAGIGIVAALRETNLARFDFQAWHLCPAFPFTASWALHTPFGEVSYIVEERRLAEESHEILIFEELPVQWPYGSFFRIQVRVLMKFFFREGWK